MRVGQIGDDRKVNVTVVIAMETNLQILHQRVYLLFAEQQRRDRNQSGAIVRDARGEVHFGQSVDRQQIRS